MPRSFPAIKMCIRDRIATAEALGLKKPGDVTVQPDTAATQGKIAKIGFMLSVPEA